MILNQDGNAKTTFYDNRVSKLESENVQDAITEVAGKFGNCEFSVDSKGAYVEYELDGATVKKKLGSGELVKLHSDWRVFTTVRDYNEGIEWSYTATEETTLLVHCFFGYGNDMVITALRNGSKISPTLVADSGYSNASAMHAYSLVLEKGETIQFEVSGKVYSAMSFNDPMLTALTAYKVE